MSFAAHAHFFLISVVPCISCNKAIREKIFDSSFLPNIFLLFSAFIVLAIIVGFLSYISTRRYLSTFTANPNKRLLNPVPFSTASIVMGIGIGGFIDGILLHQLLQWHEMISNKLPPDNYVDKSVNMFWDGVFHLFSLTVVLVGVILFWRLFHRKNIDTSGRILSGGLVLGWGLFNIVEGIIDHHLLKLHNVREITRYPDTWNYGFLALSLLMIVAGYSLIRSSERSSLKSITFG